MIRHLPAEVEAIPVVAGEFTFSRGVNHDAEFQAKDGEEREGEDPSHFRGDIGEVEGLEAGTNALHAWEAGPGECCNVARESEHCDAEENTNETCLQVMLCGEI